MPKCRLELKTVEFATVVSLGVWDLVNMAFLPFKKVIFKGLLGCQLVDCKKLVLEIEFALDI